MDCFEIKARLLLKYDIDYKKSLQPLSKLISSSLYKSPLKEIHSRKGFKYYSFSNLLKISPKGIYKKGENGFIVRTISEKIAKELSKALFLYEDDFFTVKEVSIKKISRKPINYLISLNPVIVTYTPKNSRPRQWTSESEAGVEYLIESLHKNLVKKYESFYNEKLESEDNFIEFLQIKNAKPLSIFYDKNGKEFRLLGNKLFIVPKNDENSQKLAFTALCTGLGEKNALGGGFCMGGWRR